MEDYKERNLKGNSLIRITGARKDRFLSGDFGGEKKGGKALMKIGRDTRPANGNSGGSCVLVTRHKSVKEKRKALRDGYN